MTYICRYCNSLMYSEYETLRNKSHRFFYNCPNCKSVYEGIKDKNNIIIEQRWWNPDKKEFEE